MIHVAKQWKEPAMKARRPMPREQVMTMAVFILLALLGVILWFGDPNHRPSGSSRIPWPAPAKP